MALRASDRAGSLTINVVGTSALPLKWSRYKSDENPLSGAICSARTSVTTAEPEVVPSALNAALSHCGVTPSMLDGILNVLPAVVEANIDRLRN
jgi:hypothetical protein